MSILDSNEITAIRESLTDSGVFGDLATIQASTTTISPSGGKITTWQTLTGHGNIPCYLSQVQTTKRSSDKSLYSYSAVRIRLNSNYPAVNLSHRVKIGSDIWKILDIIVDSQKVFTVLEVERWAT